MIDTSLRARLVIRRDLPARKVIVERPARVRYGSGRLERRVIHRRVADRVPAYETIVSDAAPYDAGTGYRWDVVPEGTVVAVRVYRGDDLLFEGPFTHTT